MIPYLAAPGKHLRFSLGKKEEPEEEEEPPWVPSVKNRSLFDDQGSKLLMVIGVDVIFGGRSFFGG